MMRFLAEVLAYAVSWPARYKLIVASNDINSDMLSAATIAEGRRALLLGNIWGRKRKEF